ncbi:MAG: hypothetical protein KatS3mg122_3308 [Caldimonas sp.]|nr:MAG: hypothetical protein KatS3mg122_1384 [Caldimonas sp.]GIX26077.1 MAG: hypothetical protein KatS3mg122_3308 [Caldimonas sp.]
MEPMQAPSTDRDERVPAAVGGQELTLPPNTGSFAEGLNTRKDDGSDEVNKDTAHAAVQP